MTNKKSWLGILVMLLVFGMMVVGCKEEGELLALLKIRNESTFNIRYITFKEMYGSTILADPVNIGPGGSKTYEFSNERDVSVTILASVNGEDIEFTNSRIRAIFDKKYINVVILRGASKETLVLTSTGENK